MAKYNVDEATLGVIRQFEGLKLNAYWDATRYSIGYGAGRLSNGAAVKSTDRITKEQAEDLLRRDAQEAAGYVNRYVVSNINKNMFDALTSFTYNVGAGNLQQSQLLKAVNNDPTGYDAVIAGFREPKHNTYNRGSRREQEAIIYGQNLFQTPSNNTGIFLIIAVLVYVFRKELGIA